MVRPHTGSPRMKNRSYITNYSVQNGGDHPSGFRNSREGGDHPSGFRNSREGGDHPSGFRNSREGGDHPSGFRSNRGRGFGKAPPSWREASNRGRKRPYPAPWQQKSPQGQDHRPSSWQSKCQNLGFDSQSSETHHHYGDPVPRPGSDQRRPSPHETGSGRPPHRQYDGARVPTRPPHRNHDGGPRRFESRPHAPEQRSHTQVHSQPPQHRSPFRPSRQEQRPWRRSQSPSYSPRPLPKPHHGSQAGERGRGRGRGRGRRGGGGSGSGPERGAFWGGRGSDKGHSFSSPRPHHPQPQNGEGRCPPHTPLRKEREFYSRERWSSSTERDCNARRSGERERSGSGHHGNESDHWPPPNPPQYRPSAHTPSPWKPGSPQRPRPSKPSGPRRFPSHQMPRDPERFTSHHSPRGPERFPSHQMPRGPERRNSDYKRKYPEMQDQARPPPPLFRNFRQEQSLAPPLRGFGGRGLSLRDKSRLMKNRKFREESVTRFKMLPPQLASRGRPSSLQTRMAFRPASRGRPSSLQTRMAFRPAPGSAPMPRHQDSGHHMAGSSRKLSKRSSPSRKADSEHKPVPEQPECDGDQDEQGSPPYRRSSGQHSPAPEDQQLPLDLVVVSQWQAEVFEIDGDCDEHGDAKDSLDSHSEQSSDLLKPPPKAVASPQDQSIQNKRLVRRPLMSLKTVRPLRKFGQASMVATKRSQSIVSKYRLMRQRAPPMPAPASQSVQSTSHRRW